MTDEEIPLIKQFLRHQSEFMAYLMAITRSYEIAEEVFQNSAVVVMEKASSGEIIRDFRAWSKEVVRRQAFAFLQDAERKRAKTTLIEPSLLDQITTIFVQDQGTEDRVHLETQALRKCIAQVDSTQRELLALRYAKRLSFQQIAGKVERTEAAVQRALSRLRKRLYDCVRSRLAAEGAL